MTGCRRPYRPTTTASVGGGGGGGDGDPRQGPADRSRDHTRSDLSRQSRQAKTEACPPWRDASPLATCDDEAARRRRKPARRGGTEDHGRQTPSRTGRDAVETQGSRPTANAEPVRRGGDSTGRPRALSRGSRRPRIEYNPGAPGIRAKLQRKPDPPPDPRPEALARTLVLPVAGAAPCRMTRLEK
jgi:hypothetical protein